MELANGTTLAPYLELWEVAGAIEFLLENTEVLAVG